MAVYKSKRSESSMQFVDTAKKLEAFTLSCCMKAPKRYTFFLTSRIMQLASDVHEHAAAANNIWPTNQHEAQMRRDELTRANIALQNLDPKLQLLYEAARQNPEGCKWIGKAMEQWGAMIAEEAKLLAAVRKKDRQRYKDLPDGPAGVSEEQTTWVKLCFCCRRLCSQLVGALAECQQLHEFLPGQQQRQREQ